MMMIMKKTAAWRAGGGWGGWHWRDSHVDVHAALDKCTQGFCLLQAPLNWILFDLTITQTLCSPDHSKTGPQQNLRQVSELIKIHA